MHKKLRFYQTSMSDTFWFSVIISYFKFTISDIYTNFFLFLFPFSYLYIFFSNFSLAFDYTETRSSVRTENI